MRADFRAECRLLMRWKAPTAGIAMCHIAVAIADRRESAFGKSRRFRAPPGTSGQPLRADLQPVPSTSPWGADVTGGAAAGLVLTGADIARREVRPCLKCTVFPANPLR